MGLTLADVLREHWENYADTHRSKLCAAHYRAVRRVSACRSPELGGRLYRCKGCCKPHFAYHSCNHRNCPQCGASGQQEWTARQEARLLPVPYFMVTFTIPSELRCLCLAYPKLLYDLLLKQSAAALSRRGWNQNQRRAQRLHQRAAHMGAAAPAPPARPLHCPRRRLPPRHRRTRHPGQRRLPRPLPAACGSASAAWCKKRWKPNTRKSIKN